MNPEQARTEARAKLVWGEPPGKVFEFLQAAGLGDKDALTLLDELQSERTAMIRGTGIKKIVLGSAMALLPFVAYVVFVSIGHIELKVFAITILIGAVGGWKLIEGIMMILRPGAERGDLSNLDD